MAETLDPSYGTFLMNYVTVKLTGYTDDGTPTLSTVETPVPLRPCNIKYGDLDFDS